MKKLAHPSFLKKVAVPAFLFLTQIGFGQTITGSGTASYVPKFTGASTIGNSQLFDNGTFVGIGGNTQTGGEYFSIQKNQPSYTLARISNNSTAPGAYTGYVATSQYSMSMYMFGSGYTASGMFGPNAGCLYSNGTGGMTIGNAANAPLSLWTNNLQRMSITSAGLVGIGTSIPAAPLEITQTGGSSLRFYANTYGDLASTVNLRQHFATGTDFSVYEGTTITGADILRFKIDGTTGYVRVGPTRPTAAPYNAAKFTVDGTIAVKEVYVVTTAGTWADYVFAKDYDLKKLTEVEKFVSENKHLPNIPSAQEIEKEGQGLGKLQTLQMEKIEEVYLYLFEMNKKMQKLQEENTLLKGKIEALENK